MESTPLAQLMLSVQRALIGEVTANLAAVTAGYDHHCIRLVAYFFDRPAEDEVERFERVAAEVIADFTADYSVRTETHTLAEGPPKVVQFWAFLRAGVRTDKSSVPPTLPPAHP